MVSVPHNGGICIHYDVSLAQRIPPWCIYEKVDKRLPHLYYNSKQQYFICVNFKFTGVVVVTSTTSVGSYKKMAQVDKG